MPIHEQFAYSSALPFRYHYANSAIIKTYPVGWHTDIEIIMMTQGSCHFICDGKPFVAGKGDIAVINSEVVHDVRLEDDSRFICFIIDENFCTSNGIRITELHFRDLIKDDKELCNLFYRVLKQYSIHAQSKCLDTRIKIALLQMLVHIRENYTESILPSPSKKKQQTEYVSKAINFIKENLNEKIMVKDIADYVNLSPAHLSAEFKRQTGKTITEFTNIERCNMAYVLLQKGLSVTEAATSCGFENMSYFAETFKKYMNQSPSEARK